MNITIQPKDFTAKKELTGFIKEKAEKLFRMYDKIKRRTRKKSTSAFYSYNGTSVRILQNDWLKRKNQICNAYLKAIYHAKKEIIIANSYFLPGRNFTNVLKTAAKKGIKIKLILSGISDIPIARRATRYLYSLLLRHNIELYEWNKSVLHAKAAVADDEWATIGSYNLNHLSSYGSIEMNVEIISTGFSAIFKPKLNQVIDQCEKITAERFSKSNGIAAKFINWLSYRLTRMGLIIITYLPYKRILRKYHDE